MLRDRFVMGLSDDKTQRALLAEADLTFERAVEIATAREATMRDVQAMGGMTVHNVQRQTKKSHNSHSSQSMSKPNFKSKQHGSTKSQNKSKPNSPCTGCGKLH